MRKPVSLSRYLMGNLVIIVLPLLAASAISLYILTGISRKSFEDVTTLSATLVSSRVEEFFMRPRTALSHISSILESGILYPKSELSAYLQDTRKIYPFLDRIQIVSADDIVVAVAPPETGILGVSRSGESVYERVSGTGDLFWSDSYISTSGNHPALTFGKRMGGWTVLCDLNLAWLSDFAASVHSFGAPGMQVRITDSNGVFLSYPESGPVERRERQADFARLCGVCVEGDGKVLSRVREGDKSWLVSTVRIAGPDWYVLVLYPESLFTGSLIRLEFQLLAVALLSVFAVTVFWRYRYRRIERVLSSITDQAERIAAGDYGPLVNFGGGLIEFNRIGASLDSMVTAIGERESALLGRERNFREILERIDLPAVSVDTGGLITFANSFFLALSGYTESDLLSCSIGKLVSGDAEKCPFLRILREDRAAPVEQCHLRTRTGDERIIYWSIVTVLDADGKKAGLTGIGHDMTESLEQRDFLERSIQEKDLLLRELFHRTRNNMQVIIGILSSEAEAAGNPAVSAVIQKSNDRIMSMSIVHKKLFESNDLSRIDLRDYCRDLIDFMGRGEPGTGRWIRFTGPDTPVPALIDSAVCFGLVLHELLANALEHAYPAGTGEIRVTLNLTENSEIELEVADDGVGLPSGFDVRETQGLGFTLVNGLVEFQLRGKIWIASDKGLSCHILFSDDTTLRRV